MIWMGHREYLPNPEHSHLLGYTEVKERPHLNIHLENLQAITYIDPSVERFTSLVGRTIPGVSGRVPDHAQDDAGCNRGERRQVVSR